MHHHSDCSEALARYDATALGGDKAVDESEGLCGNLHLLVVCILQVPDPTIAPLLTSLYPSFIIKVGLALSAAVDKRGLVLSSTILTSSRCPQGAKGLGMGISW